MNEGLLEFLKKEREQEWRVEIREKIKNKERPQLERIPMPEQAPDVRNQNFSEVNQGYSEEQAVLEASRCLDCPNINLGHRRDRKRYTCLDYS
mgnify:CR=1 FL=1